MGESISQGQYIRTASTRKSKGHIYSELHIVTHYKLFDLASTIVEMDDHPLGQGNRRWRVCVDKTSLGPLRVELVSTPTVLLEEMLTSSFHCRRHHASILTVVVTEAPNIKKKRSRRGLTLHFRQVVRNLLFIFLKFQFYLNKSFVVLFQSKLEVVGDRELPREFFGIDIHYFIVFVSDKR